MDCKCDKPRLIGIISNKKPLLGSIIPKQTLNGVLGYGIKEVERGFVPYVQEKELFLKTYGKIEESELILGGK